MATAILREYVYFSGAESLYKELEALDPVFRRVASIINIDFEEDITFGGERYIHGTMLLEAEIDASP